MAGQTPILLIEVLLVGGGALAFAVWQLWDVRRAQRQDRERDQGKGTSA